MKRLFIISSILLAPLLSFGAEKVIKTVTGLSSSGLTLSEAVGSDCYEMDSLVVSDPEYRLTAADMMFMRDCSERWRLRGIDLSGIRAEDDCIPAYAFANSKVNFPGLQSVASAEPGYPKIHYMRLPSGLREIGEHAFTAGDIRAVDIPRTVLRLGNGAFAGCVNLKSVTLRGKDPLRVLNDDVFSFVHPEAVLRVTPGTGHVYSSHPEWGTFASIVEDAGVFVTRSVSLTSGLPLESLLGDLAGETDSLILSGLTTSSDLAWLRDLSVTGHTRLSGLNLTACTLESLVSGSFENSNLLYCTLPVMLREIGDRSFRNTLLESVSFNPLVRSIGSCAFEDCVFLRGDIVVPEGCVSIGDGCFGGCVSTVSVMLPSTVETVGDGALRLPADAVGVRDVYVNRRVPPSTPGVTGPAVSGSGDMPASARRLYVPMGAGPAYLAAPYWRDFGSVIETALLSGGPDGIDGTVVSSCTDSGMAEVYTVSGRLVWRGTSSPRLEKGLYIIKKGGGAEKHIVR